MPKPERPGTVLPFPGSGPELERLARALAALPVEEPPAGAWERLAPRLELEKETSAPRLGAGWAVAAALAAVWLLTSLSPPARREATEDARLMALLQANQRLEAALRAEPANQASAWQAGRQRAADAELAALDEALNLALARSDTAQAEALWRRRLALLEAELEARRAPRLALTI